MRNRIASLLLFALLAIPSAGRAYDDGTLGLPSLNGVDGVDGGPKICGTGTRTVCGKTTSKRCLEWRLTSSTLGGNYGIGAGGLSGSVEYTCANWLTIELTLYKDP